MSATKPGLTALIPAGNEERHIADTIASVRFADEILVVVDSASTDRTREIAEATEGVRVLVHEYVNSAAQKNWALPQAAHHWVLVVDSDERVTPELAREVLAIVEADGPCDGYRINRRNHFIGREVRGCGWQRDDVLRLFRRDEGRYQDRHVHADIEFPTLANPSVGRTRGMLLHYTFDSFEQYIGKFFRYTEWSSEDRAARTPKVGWRHLAGRPIWRFFRQFFLYRGYRDGKAGFVICVMAAFSVFLKYARVWEKREREKRGD